MHIITVNLSVVMSEPAPRLEPVTPLEGVELREPASVDIEEPTALWQNFLGRAFMEMDEVTPPIRTTGGPHYPVFRNMMQDTSEALQRIHPSLTPESLFGASYKSPEVIRREMRLDPAQMQELFAIRRKRSCVFDRTAVDMEPIISGQIISEGALNKTPYYQQGEEAYVDAKRSCTMAAFRMAFAAMAGWSPSESNLARHLTAYYNTAVVVDEVYLKLLASPAFQQAAKRSVASIFTIGADLSYIDKLATKIKTGRPNTSVYAIANLAHDGYGGRRDEVWHKVVVLGTTEEGIVCNDPSKESGGEQIEINYRDFIRRWVATNNSVRLVVATPHV